MKSKTAVLVFSALVILSLSSGPLLSQIPIETSPSWRSNDSNLYSTGAAWGDLDGDGYLEFAISNGNDMASDPNVVYDNVGGVLETAYSWSSTNNNYSGKCALGDIDRNGWLDFVVVNYGYSVWPGGWAKLLDDLYPNVAGVLLPTPVWNTSPADSDNTFGIDLGDVDGDGDLDLATANGDAYSSQMQPTKIYYNDGTIFEDTPSWTSDELMASYDLMWGDVDRDGDLDLAVANSGGPLQVYYNTGSGLETTASWSSSGYDDHNSLAWGDMNGDGWLDLAASTNTQLGGSGHFKVYLNTNGVLSHTPSWQSSETVYGSGVAWADVDSDGDFDLAAGSWWGKSVIYENVDGWLTSSPTWQCASSYTSVVETMAWGDVDRDGLRWVSGESHPTDGSRKLFYLDHSPAYSLDSVYVDGARLDYGSYCSSLVCGWVSLVSPPQQDVLFYYTFSRDLDLGVSNWDRENFVFYNEMVVGEDVSLLVYQATRELSPGDSLRYRASVINNTGLNIEVTIIARVQLPGGMPYAGNPVYGPELVDLMPYETKDITVGHWIPPVAPSGEYKYTLIAGIPPSTLIDREDFTFTVAAMRRQEQIAE